MFLKKYFRYALLAVLLGFTTFLTLFIGLYFAEQTKDPDVSGSWVFLTLLVLVFVTFCFGLNTFFAWIENRN